MNRLNKNIHIIGYALRSSIYIGLMSLGRLYVKLNGFLSLRAFLLSMGFVILLYTPSVFVLNSVTNAQNTETTSNSGKAELTQAYRSLTPLVGGSAISLVDGSDNLVVLSSKENKDKFLGIYVDSGKSLLEFDSEISNVQVATSGRVVALVTNLNGSIKKGDLLSVSAIKGAIAKSSPGDRYIGIAQESFNDNTKNTVPHTVSDSSGNQKDIILGSVPIVLISGSSVEQQAVASVGKSSGVKSWLESIRGKKISNMRISLVFAVTVITLVILAAIIYSSIRTGVYAVSRNPLAKSYIFESLSQVIFMAIIVAILGLSVNYVILKA